MRIIKIERKTKTDKYDFTLITFEREYSEWFSKKTEVVSHMCITPNWSSGTYYASSGIYIGSNLWGTVKAFLETGDEVHEY